MAPIDDALAAIAGVKNPCYAQVAAEFGADRNTLTRRHKGITISPEEYHQSAQFLSRKQTKYLINYIKNLTTQGLPPVPEMVRKFAFDLTGKYPGKNWPSEFLKRHEKECQSRYLRGFDLARKKADSCYHYRLYFELLASKIKEYDIRPENTYNMDEKGFMLGILQATKRYFTGSEFAKGRLKGCGQDGNREWITVIASICQNMTALPPLVIYRAAINNIHDTWVEQLQTTEREIYMTTSLTGWTNDDLGFEWLTTVFDPHTKKQASNGLRWRLLFVDGHSSHLNMRFIDWCVDKRILLMAYPPHSTHRLQPLDVSLFNPLANFYSQNLNLWMQKSAGIANMSKRYFYELFWPAWQSAFTEKNIRSSWKKTGLYPFNPSEILDQLIIPEPRPPSNTSSTSTIPPNDWKRIDNALKNVVGPIIDRSTQQLQKSIDNLCASHQLQAVKIQALEAKLELQKQANPRGRGLFDELRQQQNNKALIFSPKKIQEAKRLQAERDQVKENDAARIKQKKLDQALKKAAKEHEMVERREARAIAKEERERAQQRAKELRAEAREQKAAERQLQNETKLTKRSRTKPLTKEASKKDTIEVVELSLNVNEAHLARSRRTRSIKPPKRFND